MHSWRLLGLAGKMSPQAVQPRHEEAHALDRMPWEPLPAAVDAWLSGPVQASLGWPACLGAHKLGGLGVGAPHGVHAAHLDVRVLWKREGR